MNQIQCVPAANPYMVQQQTTYMPVPQQPKYNAVNIEIHNPSVGAQQPQPQSQSCGYPAPVVYDYPQAPIYDYPQAPVYCPPGQVPVMVPQMPAQAPVQIPQTTPAPVQVPQAPAQQPAVIVPPVVPAVVNNNGPVNNVPPVLIPAQTPVQVPAPEITKPEASKPETVKPEVVQPEPVTPQVDINAFISKLVNPDFGAQRAGMEEIAALVGETPDKATDLVDTKVFDALNNIINADTSSLAGPTQAQVDARQKIISGQNVSEEEKALANTITPREQAEQNKSYAIFTTAIMDKLYADEVKKLSGKTVPLTELPGAINIVDQLKDNPNPMVRTSAIEALSYLKNSEYKQDLNTVFTVAKKDQDPGVAAAAESALNELAQV